jgi:methylglutaconyl-CoA hydratase
LHRTNIINIQIVNMYTLIETRTKNRISYITLNRPEKRNALSGVLVHEMKLAFKHATADPHTRVIVLDAKGPVFSAGADLDYLQQLQNNTYEENYFDSSSLAELFNIIYKNPKPVIAQVQGHAIAGGTGLATVCDFTFAVPEANFGYTEVKIGFIPAIVSVFLLRKIGEGKAKELLLTGKLVTAQEAKDYGLINDVIAADKLESYVEEFATKLANETSGNSLAYTKNLIASVHEMSMESGLKYAAEQNAECRATPDCKKGIAAFLNKEKITW